MKEIVYRNDSEIVLYLIKKDPKLKTLFTKIGEVIVHLDNDYFVSLVNIIIAQQLSSVVAKILSKRLQKLCGDHITPKKLLQLDDQQLKEIGLSKQKTTYLKSLSNHVASNQVDLEHLNTMSNEEIMRMLIDVKGIGPWSVHMFLMFALGRENVFSTFDLGLRNAIKTIYNDPTLTVNQIDEISQTWAPYQSIVAHFLWHIWDNESILNKEKSS